MKRLRSKCARLGAATVTGPWRGAPAACQGPGGLFFVMTLGWHWILDASGCSPERIADPSRLREVLELLPAHLGLTPVGPPQHFEHREASGHTLAGLVLLEESHLSVHAHPGLGVLQVDLFSCARFEPERALTFLEERYAFTDVEQRLLERGLPGRPAR